jgi:sugar fermentation stimulation protein A
MQFPQPLERGLLIARYKRFFADVMMDDGRAITAHCPNPGAMLGLNAPGLPVWLSRSDDPKRKLAHTLELVEADGGLVGVNTMHPNRLVAEALAEGWIPELAGYGTARREVKYGAASRVDFLLSEPTATEAGGRARCWIEVKGVTLHRGGGLAEWPDCVSSRAVRHLTELEAMVATGDRAVVLFVVQRMDCEEFSACGELDPAFARGLERATAAGVEVLAYACDIGLAEVRIRQPLVWRRERPGPR